MLIDTQVEYMRLEESSAKSTHAMTRRVGTVRYETRRRAFTRASGGRIHDAAHAENEPHIQRCERRLARTCRLAAIQPSSTPKQLIFCLIVAGRPQLAVDTPKVHEPLGQPN